MKVDVYLIWHTNLKGHIFVQWLPSSTRRETDPVSPKLSVLSILCQVSTVDYKIYLILIIYLIEVIFIEINWLFAKMYIN